MFKVAALLLLLVNQPVRYEVIGQLSCQLRTRFGQVRLESLDGRFVEQTDSGPDGRFRLTKIPDGQYVVTVRIGRIREIRQTISVFPEFADKKRRVSFKLDVEKAIVQQSAQKANVAALLVPDKARTELRKSFEAKGDLEKAQQHLEAALKIAPNFEEALNNLGTIYYRKHDFVAAKDLFERALKTNPESFVGRVNLGGALLGLGQFDRALAENSKAAAQRPTDSLAQAQLGLSFFYLRRLDEALPHLEQAKQTDPFSPALPGLFLAMIHESMGNTSAAIAEYAEFLKMHPNHAASTNVERKSPCRSQRKHGKAVNRRSTMKRLLSALALLAAIPVLAWQSSVTVILGPTIIDGTGRPGIKNGALVIENGRIRDVGPRGTSEYRQRATDRCEKQICDPRSNRCARSLLSVGRHHATDVVDLRKIRPYQQSWIGSRNGCL